MTNPDLDSHEFYGIQWVQNNPTPDPAVSWPSDGTSAALVLTWTPDQLKRELSHYEVFLRKSLKALTEPSEKKKSSRQHIMSFEEDVRLYKEYVEATLIDVQSIAETLMRPSFLSQYLSFFSDVDAERLILRFNSEGPVKSIRRLRLSVAEKLRKKNAQITLQDMYFELPKSVRFFWPNLQTIELAFQSILKSAAFKI